MSDLVTLKTVRWRQKGLESNWTCMVYFSFTIVCVLAVEEMCFVKKNLTSVCFQ